MCVLYIHTYIHTYMYIHMYPNFRDLMLSTTTDYYVCHGVMVYTK